MIAEILLAARKQGANIRDSAAGGGRSVWRR